MAAYKQGYDEERFASTVDRNFLCLICFCVLRDPVLCPTNHHCFCRACITRHLQNSRRCPTCADNLSVRTLTEPPRMVKDYLNELNIHCVYKDRGCQEIVQLQRLQHHESSCGFAPVVCSNEGCEVTVNQRDRIHHESEVCEFRKVKCHSCAEVTNTLAEMERRVGRIERNMAVMEGNVATNMRNLTANVERNVAIKVSDMEKNLATNLTNMERNVTANMERNVATNVSKVTTNMTNMERRMDEKLKVVKNKVSSSQTALVRAFDEMKDVLAKVEDKIDENPRKRRRTASGDRENIIVAGGLRTESVEMFNWRQRTWSPLQSMPKVRHGATSFVYNNHVTIAGSYCPGHVDDMIRMNIHPNPDLSMHWSDCPVKLPTKLSSHSSVLYNDHLMVSGGDNGNAVSDCIHEVQLVPPYTVKTLSRMPEPRQEHSMERFDDSLLIVGGTTTGSYQDSLSSVVLYDIKKNKWKQLAPLPYEVSSMATVRWGDNIVVIGGIDDDGEELDTVIIYNVKTEQYHMLPAMRCKRWGCAAVVIENNIVVLGGADERQRSLKSVEVFNFESYTWQELPEMSERRFWHTAVVV